MLHPLRAPRFKDLVPSANLGAPGELVWLDPQLLRVDRLYQRSLDHSTSLTIVRAIVERFSWAKFQPVIVSRQEDGGYAIIDGQHRATAALVHPDIATIPCWVIGMESTVDEAKAFVGINRDRKNLTQLQIFKAQLAAADPDAVQVKKVTDAAGVTINYGSSTKGVEPPRSTQAISTIRRLIAVHGEAPVRLALDSMAKASGDRMGQIRGPMISAVTIIVAKNRQRLDFPRLVLTLQGLDGPKLAEEASGFASAFGGKLDLAIAAMIVKAYNRRLAAANQLEAA